MAGSAEVIREYLVSLGFQSDKTSYDNVTKQLDSFSKKLTEFGGQTVKLFGQAATAVAAFGVAATAGIAKFMGGLGDQQIEMEKLSRQLWTTQQQATAFNATLKAMGANLQDLYLSPTLMQQYEQLHAVAMQMQAPSDYNKQIHQVQDVQLQIKQMRLEAYYSLQWIGYYFIKYMQGPIAKVHDVLASINEVVVKNMPTWTKKAAEWMASFVQAGINIGDAVGSVYTWLKKMLSYIPGWAKGVVAALAIFSLSNPFMLFIEAIGGAILLLDDFETYIHGGKSALGPFWASLIKVVDALKKFGALQAVIAGVAGAFLAFKILTTVVGWVNALRAAFAGLSIAMDANPIGLISLAIGALIFGIVMLIQHWKEVKTAAGNALDWIKQHLDMILPVLGPSGLIAEGVYQIVKHFGTLKSIAGDAWAVVRTAAMDTLNWIISGIDNIIKIADKIPGIKIPLIPSLDGPLLSGPGGAKTSYGATSYPYAHPQATTTTTKTVNVTANQTNHIHGTSPQATANAVNQGFNRNLHNLRGVIV